MNRLKAVVTLSLVLSSMPSKAEQTARELLDKARDFVASTQAIQPVDTTEQSTVTIIGEVRIEPNPRATIVTIEIDRPKQLVRQTTMRGKHEQEDLNGRVSRIGG